MVFYPSRWLPENTALRNDKDKKWSEPCILGEPSKNMQALSGPMVGFLSPAAAYSPFFRESC
jgi:hypothetical protein